MGKKINLDKLDADRSPEESEDILDTQLEADATKASGDSGKPDIVGGIDVAKIIKSTGGIQSAASSASPHIDQFAAQARLEAQRASAQAMKEYRRQMQGIVGSMQATIRDEGVRLADEICARITTQIRQAVLLETEKKALGLVDEFVLGWQIEAESMSQELLTVSPGSSAEASSGKTSEKLESSAAMKEPPMVEKPVMAVEAEKEVSAASSNQVAEKVAVSMSAKKPETSLPERPKAEQSETEKKVVFDFATFIAQSKSPVKS